jgi:hypothetical protein
MKYNLFIKESDTETKVIEYKSLAKIARDLNVTYCSVYQNFIFNDSPDVKPSKKTSQIKFNSKYTIKVISI